MTSIFWVVMACLLVPVCPGALVPATRVLAPQVQVVDSSPHLMHLGDVGNLLEEWVRREVRKIVFRPGANYLLLMSVCREL